jgi:hypothetical protein
VLFYRKKIPFEGVYNNSIAFSDIDMTVIRMFLLLDMVVLIKESQNSILMMVVFLPKAGTPLKELILSIAFSDIDGDGD